MVALESYNIIRRDRTEAEHGGVCVYIKNTIKFTVVDDLKDPSFEALWIQINPTRLPRGFSSILLGALYHPPSANDSALLEYLERCLSSIETRYSNCGLCLVGDFNKLQTTRLRNSYNLKQIVNFPTRGERTLDLVLTNLQDHYESPTQRPPLGLSDHMSIEVQPKMRIKSNSSTTTIKSRDMRPSKRLAMRTYLESVDLDSILNSADSCESKTSLLEQIIMTGLDHVMPMRMRKVHSTEPPWITSSLKSLIQKRQSALSRGDDQKFRELRNRVNRERKMCRANYYQAKVEHLKKCKPSEWWKEVKKLSGCSLTSTAQGDMLKSIQLLHEGIDQIGLANIINEAFLSPMNCFTPLPATFSGATSRNYPENPLVVSAESVRKKLSNLNPYKANGPDNIPGWLLKEHADILAGPVSDILNYSYREGRLPSSWKHADVIPVPKQKPVREVNKHLRPISLTPILSKMSEEYVVDSYVKPAVLERIDPQQFGAIPNSSTTHALLSMLHSWLESTDGNGATTRVMLFDFRKAFDLIDHHVLAQKLSSYDFPESIMCWILDFLTNRRQRVKLSRDCVSEWRAVPAGVPQGTKLGPWLFLIMINDLSVANMNIWKYVDDTTLAECVEKNGTSSMQSRVNEFVSNSRADGFQLNESKCKELRISFTKSKNTLEPVTINNTNIEVVPSAKLLGVMISNDLKWNVHVEMICKKVAARLYFLRQLKRAKVPANDLLSFYTTCIRPVVEYASPVFHTALPQYLSDQLERLQKRALRIIGTNDLSYRQALEVFNIPTLYDRREAIGNLMFQEIINNNNHKLHPLLPPPYLGTLRTRKNRKFQVPRFKTNRFGDSFIISHCR